MASQVKPKSFLGALGIKKTPGFLALLMQCKCFRNSFLTKDLKRVFLLWSGVSLQGCRVAHPEGGLDERHHSTSFYFRSTALFEKSTALRFGHVREHTPVTFVCGFPTSLCLFVK